jgi:hypothetical protein
MVVASPFADLGGRQVAWTGDRMEFLERNGALDHPAALDTRDPLSNRVGAGRAGVGNGNARTRCAGKATPIAYVRDDFREHQIPEIRRIQQSLNCRILANYFTTREAAAFRLRAARLTQLRSRGLAPGRDGGQGALRSLGQWG